MNLGEESSLSWKEYWKMAKDFHSSAKKNFELDDYKTAANRAYLSAESAVKAGLKFTGKQVSTKHQNNWTNSVLLELGIDTFSLLQELYDLRLQADYGTVSEVVKLNKEEVSKYMKKLEDLLEKIKKKFEFKV